MGFVVCMWWRQSTWTGARHRSGTGRWRAAQSCTTKQWVHQLGRECVPANMHHTVAVLQRHPNPQLCDNLGGSSAARRPGRLPFSCSAAPGRWMRCSMVCLVRLPHSPNISFSCPIIPAPNQSSFSLSTWTILMCQTAVDFADVARQQCCVNCYNTHVGFAALWYRQASCVHSIV